jgi:hypothetical protein
MDKIDYYCSILPMLIYNFETLYTPLNIVTEIPREEAIEVGKSLIETGYKMIGSYVIYKTNWQTVGNIIREFDRSTRNDPLSSTSDNNDILVGPYYSNSKGDDYCPTGLGFWVSKIQLS